MDDIMKYVKHILAAVSRGKQCLPIHSTKVPSWLGSPPFSLVTLKYKFWSLTGLCSFFSPHGDSVVIGEFKGLEVLRISIETMHLS